MPVLRPPVPPMLARLVRELPPGLRYEPKWDGFRCVAFVDGPDVVLQSRNGRPLQRYFPEIVAALAALDTDVVLDGEIVVTADGVADFPALLARIHPAASRVRALAERTPARFVVFDCLATGDVSLLDRPLCERTSYVGRVLPPGDGTVHCATATDDVVQAQEWLDSPSPAWDGVVAKDPASTYEPGRRVMVKVKPDRTADCVVAGVRLSADLAVTSLLLGLWAADGTLHHPGAVTAPPRQVKADIGKLLPGLVVPLDDHPWREGFGVEGGATGRLKGAGGRWLPGMTQDWVPVSPVLVAEVAYDRLDGLRFRHPARFRHWRTDRDAGSCSVDQLVVGR